jgi:serine/threonine protein kinase
MLQLHTCAQGHFWEAPEGAAPPACPTCGGAADALPLLDPPPLAPPAADPAPAATDECRGRPAVKGYDGLEDLGRGPTGVASFKAHQIAANRTVLLKVVTAREDPGQLAWGGLHGEATALAKLRHPSVVQLFESGERDRQLFYNAVEWVDGPTLAEHLGGRPLPVREAVRLAEALARAAHHAHERGVVHRNLQPAAVRLQPEKGGRAGGPYCALGPSVYLPRITDWGLGRRPVEGDTIDLDLQRGLPSYLAPEQAWGRAKQIGPQTDVYALGALLYEFLTGRPPFRGDGVSGTLELIQCKEPPAPRTLRRRVPRDLEAVCLKCLHKQPRRRYANAWELAEDLRRFDECRPVLAGGAGALRRIGLWLRRHPALTSCLATLACVCLLWLVASAKRGTGVTRHAPAANRPGPARGVR